MGYLKLIFLLFLFILLEAKANKLGTIQILDNTSILILSDEEHKYLEKKKEIKVCVDPSWLPFEKLQNGKYIGMSADYFKIFEKKIGINFKIIQTKNWSQSVEFAKQRKCDIFSLVMQTKNRKKNMNFTDPYISVPLVIATTHDKLFISNIDDILNKKIGITKDYAFIEILKAKYPSINLVEVSSVDDGLEKLINGDLYAFIDNLSSIAYKIQKSYIGRLKIAGQIEEKWELGIGARNDEEILVNIFNKIIFSIDEKTRQNILNQWMSIEYNKGFDYSIFWKLLGLIIIFIFIVNRQYLLKKSNTNLELRINEATKKIHEKNKYLFHQSKMASMGEMIENIAHQWRQPLAQVNSSVLVIDAEMQKDAYTNDIVENKLLEIESLTQYMSKTINDFQNFFNPNKESENFYLDKVIKNSISILKGSFDSNNIEVITSLNNLYMHNGYQNEFQQVILMILNNAKDALISRGIKEAKIKISIRSFRDNYIVSIYDNAGGIKYSLMDKLFEPYFTTKNKAQGTGLGLYISKMIIEDEMKGRLSVKNNKDGACFSISLKKGDI